MALRAIYWLRPTKQDSSGRKIPRTAMKAVRRALNEIAALKLDLLSEDGARSVAVDRSGGIVIEQEGRAQRPGGQSIIDADTLDLLAPFASREGLHGPPVKACGLLFAYLSGICQRTTPERAQVWRLNAVNRTTTRIASGAHVRLKRDLVCGRVGRIQADDSR
jgi:hypothetical protein